LISSQSGLNVRVEQHMFDASLLTNCKNSSSE